MNEVLIHIHSSNAGARIDKYIADKFNVSRSKVQKLIKSQQVKLLNNIISDNDHVVKPGEVYYIDLTLNDHSALVEPNGDINIDIIYEDNDIIILNKQSGLTVHPGAGTSNNTLLHALAAYLGYKPRIIHRLDKDTSGLMVIAKNEEAQRFLSELLLKQKVKREYLAVIWGVPLLNEGTIKNNIAPKRYNREVMQVVKTGGKHSITHYLVQKIIGNKKRASLVKCILGTGRTHQIRVHMSHLGHSIVGDQVYGKNGSKVSKYTNSSNLISTFHRQALHAYKLGLYHPKSKNYKEFYSDLPQDITNLIDEFKNLY
ncbi:RluA family pseudouridine synthase [Wolbachia endosymbiont of Pentidionis agamae]|uniref:RluA family pseudouridine synthase n=1 Tax=Wolbachia endosymbiont of Pentidionis agamae TaxID=3110435 RepID=UPI002FD1F014